MDYKRQVLFLKTHCHISQISLQFSNYQIRQFTTIFLEKVTPFDLLFSVNFCYLVWWNEQRDFFFLVMVAMKTKKMLFLWFPWQRLLREKFLSSFQNANVGKYSLRVPDQSNHYFFKKMSQPIPFFPVTRPLNPSNGFVMTRKWIKISWFHNL